MCSIGVLPPTLRIWNMGCFLFRLPTNRSCVTIIFILLYDPQKTLPLRHWRNRYSMAQSIPTFFRNIPRVHFANFTGRAPVDMASVERDAPTDIHRLAKPWYSMETVGPVAAQMATNARNSTQRCVSSHSRPVSVSLSIVPQGMLLEPKGPPLNAQTSLVKWKEKAEVTSSWLIF